MVKGFYLTHVCRSGRPYEPASWWDNCFYTNGIADARTISSRKSALTAAYHYASVELILSRFFVNSGQDVEEKSVLDLGSGAGHWISWYLDLGAAECTAIELSHQAADRLHRVYQHDHRVTVHHGSLLDVLPSIPSNSIDIINAIGIMFHIVDDREWKHVLTGMAECLRPGGVLVIGGYFGIINNNNVQHDSTGAFNKRLRSRASWHSCLRGLHFTQMRLYRNHAYLWISDVLPENNVLIARKEA
jgi:cyclopropane fatty-acyl-phospholipid synthase-like methyltransferase